MIRTTAQLERVIACSVNRASFYTLVDGSLGEGSRRRAGRSAFCARCSTGAFGPSRCARGARRCPACLDADYFRRIDALASPWSRRRLARHARGKRGRATSKTPTSGTRQPRHQGRQCPGRTGRRPTRPRGLKGRWSSELRPHRPPPREPHPVANAADTSSTCRKHALPPGSPRHEALPPERLADDRRHRRSIGRPPRRSSGSATKRPEGVAG
jgi:hypothetical protein